MSQFVTETSIKHGHLELDNIPFTDDIIVKVIIIPQDERVLFKPFEDLITRARGCLKGTGFSSQHFKQLKQAEKELER